MSDVRFENPPVNSVDLTIYFEPVQGLQVSHFSGLREAWRQEYPDTAELPPLRPHNRGGNETSVMRVEQAWPFPYLMFGNADGTGTIGLQNDRFTRSWRFTEGSTYPGFRALAADLEERLDEFKSVVKTETDQALEFVAAECEYRNRLDDALAGGAVIGVLTKWRTPQPEVAMKARYTGLRLHTCDDEEADGCALWVSVDVDDDGVFLAITSETNGSVYGEPLAGLGTAHDRLIDTFVELTSEEMQTLWGRQQ